MDEEGDVEAEIGVKMVKGSMRVIGRIGGVRGAS